MKPKPAKLSMDGGKTFIHVQLIEAPTGKLTTVGHVAPHLTTTVIRCSICRRPVRPPHGHCPVCSN